MENESSKAGGQGGGARIAGVIGVLLLVAFALSSVLRFTTGGDHVELARSEAARLGMKAEDLLTASVSHESSLTHDKVVVEFFVRDTDRRVRVQLERGLLPWTWRLTSFDQR
jgi:hypothetical protein